MLKKVQEEEQNGLLSNHVRDTRTNSSGIYEVTEGLQSPHTIVAYRRNFKHFLDYIKIHDRQVLLDYSPKVIESFIIDYIKHLRDTEKLHLFQDSYCRCN